MNTLEQNPEMESSVRVVSEEVSGDESEDSDRYEGEDAPYDGDEPFMEEEEDEEIYQQGSTASGEYDDTDDEIEEEASAEAAMSHLDDEGRPRMVDISSKPVTARTAIATGYVRMSRRTLELLERQDLPKGDALTVAEVAGIMAAKRTSDLVPLCHPLPLTNVIVRCEVTPSGVLIRSEASTQAQTGVEMEALTAASVAALALYDMCKSVDREIIISDVRLNSKTGGASGDWQATTAPPYAPVEEEPVEIHAEERMETRDDDADLEEDEEQIVPKSIPQPEPMRDRAPYRRDSWTPAARPQQRPPYDPQQRGYTGNRPGGGYGYNQNRPGSGSGYPPRPAGSSRPTPGPGYRGPNQAPGQGERRPGGYGGGKPGYGGSGYSGGYQGNRDRESGPYNRPQTPRPGGYQRNRDDNRTGGYNQNPGYRGSGYQGNRNERPGGYNNPGRPGFAGFRERRDRERENE